MRNPGVAEKCNKLDDNCDGQIDNGVVFTDYYPDQDGDGFGDDKAQAVLAHLADGCGVRQTSRLTGVGTNTVTRYALRAGGHARQLHDELVGFSPLDQEGPAR